MRTRAQLGNSNVAWCSVHHDAIGTAFPQVDAAFHAAYAQLEQYQQLQEEGLVLRFTHRCR